jgi:hypothetical protein
VSAAAAAGLGAVIFAAEVEERCGMIDEKLIADRGAQV